MSSRRALGKSRPRLGVCRENVWASAQTKPLRRWCSSGVVEFTVGNRRPVGWLRPVGFPDVARSRPPPSASTFSFYGVAEPPAMKVLQVALQSRHFGSLVVRGANPGMKRRDSGFEGRFGAPLQGLRGEQWACGRSLASEVREPGNVFGTRDAQAVTEVAPE